MPRLSKIGAAALAAFGWTGLSSVSASYLVVAGGGGGGTCTRTLFESGGGGGAGGYLTGTTFLNPTQSYTVTVGAGGAGVSAARGLSGSNSVFNAITSTGGGGGSGGSAAALTGGSGGGGEGWNNTTGASGTSGQGNAGGNGTTNGGNAAGGGGGGASAVGSNGVTNTGGAGGAGSASSISGTSVTYAGGGGGAGGSVSGAGGAGGTGGGGAGRSFAENTNGGAGTANLGGGGGGTNGNTGGNGGSGVVIISYTSATQLFGGGTVTQSGGKYIHTFTSSGALSPLSSVTASYLVVAGGAGGGNDNAGGGGAGGMLTGSGIILDTNSIYTVTVGSGGAGSTSAAAKGTNGTNSLFSIVTTTAVGGGGGGSDTAGARVGANGGSGGGGAGNGSSAGGTGTAGQGNNGGSGFISGSTSLGGGGGGAGAVGQNANTTANQGGNGGNGLTSSISGTSTYYAGGGGGGNQSGTSTAASGGLGGGGAGGCTPTNTPPVAGTANLGGGGGGGLNSGRNGANGGAGVVIISYAGSTQLMAGGTVTVAGGNVIHTFTSSGYLTPIVLVNNSLRFRRSASAFLSRTPTVAGNRRTFTLSLWWKRGIIHNSVTNERSLFSAVVSGNTYSDITFAGGTGDSIRVYKQTSGADTFYLETNAVYRDPSAWYHIVAAVDTTQATASNRVALYVNGVQQTFTGSSYPSQNLELDINNTVPNYFCRIDGSSVNPDGYMAEANFIDGQALTPNSFGTFNGLGVWQPIRYGGSYGTNGFYLPFNAGTLSYAGLFNGSSQYLSLTANSSLQFGTGDFTVEGWYYQNGTVNYGNIFSTTLLFGTTGGLRLSTGPNNNTFQVATGGSGLINASVAFSASRWNHFAVVRSSGVTTLYQNGVSVGSASDSNSYTANTFVIGWVDGSGSSAYLLNGLLSNFRVVKGTAVYTANFTPSTLPLTAISGTSLLTLQNATIIDNSTNAFSITNNGTVTTGQTYPCSTALFNDQGPAGNNWTPNNISGQFGSTLDSMTDVPTLTSATTANYGVYNPLNKFSSTTITNGNLLVTNGSSGDGWSTTGSTFAFPQTGKWYAEFTIVNRPFSGSTGIGIVPSNINFLNQSGDSARFAWGRVYFDNSGIIGPNNASVQNTTQAPTYTTGDIISVAFDSDNGTVWWAKNGTWTNSGNPATGTNPAYTGLTATAFPMGFVITSEGYSSSQIAGNWGQQPFTYTPPSGFVRMNTFNIAAPTIGATASTTANKYFDATTYTGNGFSTSGTQSITNSGSMQPDFVWIKSRSAVQIHSLTDSVRGVTKQLFSNLTDAEQTDSNQITSINSNGFSLGTNATGQGGVNVNGTTYVAWQWRASNATAVTNTAGSITSTVSANTTAGFSIVTYTGNGTNGATVGHGLGVAPSLMFVKDRSQGGTYRDWAVYSPIIGAGNSMYLNTTSSSFSKPSYWNSTTATSTVFTLGNDITVNQSGDNFVAYCFAAVAGYSAFGSYTGNGSNDGPFIYLGFRPRFVMIKRTDSTGNWIMFDSARGTYNVNGPYLYANSSSAEGTSTTIGLDFLSNGFKNRNTYNDSNTSSGTYIYMAFAESPFKYANAE